MTLSLQTHPAPRPTVLLVEDDSDIRLSLAELLEDAGYRVVQVMNGFEAEVYLRSNPRPACLLLDLWMPVMNGWTFAQKMRAGELPEIPTIVLTAASHRWSHPGTHVLRKPLDADELLSLVRSLASPGA